MKIGGLKRFIRKQLDRLKLMAHRPWYFLLIAWLAALDNFLIVIPNDGILISSSMLNSRRWLRFAISMAIGSTIGGVALAGFVEFTGLPWIIEMFPDLVKTTTWIYSQKFFESYGLWVVFAVSISPIMQHPAIILAGLAGTPLAELTVIVFVGRGLKFIFLSYLASHVPHYLQKLWGIKGEMKEVGLEHPGQAQ